MTRTYMGIDCEMTGTDWEKHQLCQIGLCLDPRNSFQYYVSDIGWPKGTYNYDPESLEVNKFTFERIEAGPPVNEVEDQILEFFEAMEVKKGTIVPVGFAVQTFDMPFINAAFPRLREWFVAPKNLYNPYIFRCCDLTDVTLMLGANLTGKKRARNVWGFDGWKKAGKRYAEVELKKIDVKPDWHDAGYDARAAMLQLEFYQKHMIQPDAKELSELGSEV